MASNPARASTVAAAPKSSTTRAIPSALMARVRRMASGLNTGEGDTPRRPVPGGHGPGVADLRGGCRALAVDRLDQPGQAGRGVGGDDQLVRRPAPVRGHGAVRHGRHPDPAGGDPLVELDQLLAHDVLAGETLEGGGLDDAVAQRQGTEPGWREGVDAPTLRRI